MNSSNLVIPTAVSEFHDAMRNLVDQAAKTVAEIEETFERVTSEK